MDFHCNFNDLNFCQYSNLGWGFQKSVFYTHRVKAALNYPSHVDYFPCSVLSNTNKGSSLEKKISVNITEAFCLLFDYLLEENGKISVTDGINKWSKEADGSYLHWKRMAFPINVRKMEHLSDINSDSATLKITGQSVCVDNFTVSNQPCPLFTTIFDNSFSLNPTAWLTHPLSILVAIMSVILLLLLTGLISSIIFARKSQQTLSQSKQLIRKSKPSNTDPFSFHNSPGDVTTINSCYDTDTLRSDRFFAHHNRCLPSISHVRSNPQLVHYSRQSFAAPSLAEASETTPQLRFSLALTEDAQVQLLMTNAACPLSLGDSSPRFAPANRQQSVKLSHKRDLSATSTEKGQHDPSISVVVSSTFCEPILDQSESDLSIESGHINIITQNVRKGERRRPIRESMNIGYVSDTSDLCDLPQYDTAVQLLAEHKIKLANSSEDNCNNNGLIDYY